MYKNYLKQSGEYLAAAQVLPLNTNADGNGGAKEFNGSMGGVEIAVLANIDISIATTKSITVTVLDSADNVTFTAVSARTKTAGASAMTFKAGDPVMFVGLPSDLRKYSKVNIATTDTGAVGKVDVVLNFLPH
ncbi:hypothetical protein dsx2_2641 [Desulfovibrio sp. X2]|uniref:hypothetical protein n=1 Tax=Desulfovibrio sp. X2 TaxID=941449 RepID=UPI000358B215|nr:hypothetical protein [Desulfovibrio sp. X2]EPR42724.1 hypothetical protein dsx2_2641 [Desulfovibrio sp. X2]